MLSQYEDIKEAIQEVKDHEGIEQYLDIGNDVYVSIRSPLWLIDIRYWYSAEDGTMKPKRCGISLRFREFDKLMNYSLQINEGLASVETQ